MVLLDFLVIAGLGLFVYKGFKNGFFRAIIYFAAFMVVYFVSTQLMAKSGVICSHFLILLPETARVFGFLVVLIISCIVGYLVVHRLKFVDLKEDWQNSKVNKLSGAIVGLIGGIMLLGVLTMAFIIFPIQGKLQSNYQESYVRKVMQRGSVLLYDQSWGRITKGKTYKIKLTEKLGDASTWENENFSEFVHIIHGKPAPETETGRSDDLIFNPRRGRKD